MGEVRARIAEYVGASSNEIVFFPNATTTMNALLQGLPISKGEIIYSDREYPACATAARYAAQQRGLGVREFPLPPLPTEPREIIEAILEALIPRTRLVFVSHVLSWNGMTIPVVDLAEALEDRGVGLVVDGAHGPGQVPLRLGHSRIAAYAGNLHKWFMGPKGTAFAWVPERIQTKTTPLFVGFGGYPNHLPPEQAIADMRPGGNAFQAMFGMQGCLDLAPVVALNATLEFRRRIGENRILARLRQLAAYCRGTFARELDCELLTPTHPDLSGAMSTFRIPAMHNEGKMLGMAEQFRDRYGITVGFMGDSMIRVAPHIYNMEAEIDHLVECIKKDIQT